MADVLVTALRVLVTVAGAVFAAVGCLEVLDGHDPDRLGGALLTAVGGGAVAVAWVL